MANRIVWGLSSLAVAMAIQVSPAWAVQSQLVPNHAMEPHHQGQMAAPVAHPRDAKKFTRLVFLVSHEPDAEVRLRRYLHGHTGGGGGGGHTALLPKVTVTPVAIITGVDKASATTLDKQLTAHEQDIRALRITLTNNPAATNALASARIDPFTVVAVDVLPSGQLEVFTL